MRFLIILIFIFLHGADIKHTKQALNHTKSNIKKMNKKLDFLAENIFKTEKNLKNLNSKIHNLNKRLLILKNSLKNSSVILNNLNKNKKNMLQKQKKIKEKIISFLSQNYYINSKKIETINDLIYTSLSDSLLTKYSKQIEESIKRNQNIEKNIYSIDREIKQIIYKQKQLANLKKDLTKLKIKQQRILNNLKRQKETYKQKLENMLKKENDLQKKLAKLKIIKERKKTANVANLKNLNVKKVGNAYIKPKVVRYRGRKTIPPVRGKVIKKFGSYIDPIYKIKIYNDSITIKTRPNALVKSIFSGKVIYIGENNGKKIIFIKHRNHLFSIYGNLYKISPLIKKGSYVRKGQIIARVKNRLEFEVTYKDKAINPLQVINLR